MPKVENAIQTKEKYIKQNRNENKKNLKLVRYINSFK